MSDEELDRLGRVLGYDPMREPPADRVAALRAAAEQVRADRGPDAPVAAIVSSTARVAHRRKFIVGGMAASLAGAAGYAVRALTDDDAPAGPPTEALTLATVPAGVRADASLINHTWGTELLLDIAGLPAERNYDVTFVDGAGAPVSAGSFRGVADVLMKCRFNAATLRADLRSIAVTETDGAEVLRVDLA